MLELTMPEVIWGPSILRLPARMLPSLSRWVVLGTMAADHEAELSRHTGGRV